VLRMEVLPLNSETPLVVREREAGRLLGVSVAALRRWRHERRGPPFVRIERCVGYRVADLEAFVAMNTVAHELEGNADKSSQTAAGNAVPEDHDGR